MTPPNWSAGPVSVVHVATVPLIDDPGGSTRCAVLETTGTGELGIWEIDPGTHHDVEVDEAFVVLSGRALIQVDGGADQVVAAGDVVRLRAGTATTWVVTERLRKVYLTWDD